MDSLALFKQKKLDPNKLQELVSILELRLNRKRLYTLREFTLQYTDFEPGYFHTEGFEHVDCTTFYMDAALELVERKLMRDNFLVTTNVFYEDESFRVQFYISNCN